MVFNQTKQGVKQADNNENINKGHDGLYVYNGNDSMRRDPGQQPSGMTQWNERRTTSVEDPGVRAALASSGMTLCDGFTLIELLVVVLIIGILAAVAIPQYQKAVLKSRLVQMVVWMDGLKKGAELYYLANNAYPTDLRDMDVDLNAKEYKNSVSISPGTKAAFFDDTTECIVHESATACMSKDFYLLRWHDHTFVEPKGIMCRGRNPMAEAVCKSSSDGVEVKDYLGERYYIIGN